MSTTLERVRERSLDLGLWELGGEAPGSDVADLVFRRFSSAVEGGGSLPVPSRPVESEGAGRSGLLAAALVFLGLSVTIGVFGLVAGAEPADGPVVFLVQGGELVAYDMTCGDVHWRSPVPRGSFGAPVVSDGKICVATADGRFLVVRADTGEVLGRHQIGGKGFVLDGRVPLLPSVGHVLACLTNRKSGKSRLAKLALQTGRLVWSTDLPAAMRGAVLVSGPLAAKAAPRPADAALRSVVVACAQGWMVKLALADGGELARKQIKLADVRPPVTDGRTVLVSGDSQLFAVRASDLRPSWSVRLGHGSASPPVLMGGQVFVATDQLTSYDIASGRVHWRVAGILEGARLRATAEHIVVADRDELGGRLSLYRIRNGLAQWLRRMPGKAPEALVSLAGYAAYLTKGQLLAYRLSDSLPKWRVPVKGAASALGGVDLGGR